MMRHFGHGVGHGLGETRPEMAERTWSRLNLKVLNGPRRKTSESESTLILMSKRNLSPKERMSPATLITTIQMTLMLKMILVVVAVATVTQTQMMVAMQVFSWYHTIT